MLKKLGAVLSSIALAGLVFAPCLAFAADAADATEKVETVNVTTTATGAVEKTEVDVTLKNVDSAAELRDISTLSDIKGKDGASYTSSGDVLIWKADGKDVSYSGTTSVALPISMSVTYRLDGRVVSPEEIAGKSGDVSIRYDFTNESPIEGHPDMCVPFTCITALMFNGDDFTDVKVTNGKVIDDGSDAIVTGYAMPGLKQSLGLLVEDSDIPDYFEVTAKAKNFELKSTMTIVTAGLMADLDVDGLGFGDLDGTSAGLSEGMAQLKSGASELSDGAKALSGGADGMATGAEGLSQGLYAFVYGTNGNPGISDMVDSSKKLVSGLEDLNGNLSSTSEGLATASSGLSKIADAYPADVTALLASIEASDLSSGDKAALRAVLGSTGNVKELAESISGCSDGIAKISGGYAEIAKNAVSLPAGIAQAVDAAEQLYHASAGLAGGANEVSSATTQLAEGTESLAKGLVEFDEQGISKIVSMIDNDLGGLKRNLTVLSDAASAYDSFAGKTAGAPGSVKFVFQTAAVEAD